MKFCELINNKGCIVETLSDYCYEGLYEQMLRRHLVYESNKDRYITECLGYECDENGMPYSNDYDENQEIMDKFYDYWMDEYDYKNVIESVNNYDYKFNLYDMELDVYDNGTSMEFKLAYDDKEEHSFLNIESVKTSQDIGLGYDESIEMDTENMFDYNVNMYILERIKDSVDTFYRRHWNWDLN